MTAACDRSAGPLPALRPELEPFTSTIFAEMTGLAVRTQSVNLGQGFPNYEGPGHVIEAAREALVTGYNQYPPAPGYPVLREAIARHQQRFYGIDLDPDTDVLVTAGATEAIAAVIRAFAGVGDEVVVFEPYYDSYAATIAIAGAERRTVALSWPDLDVNEEALRAACSERTRLILINTPHNPTGKVFTRAELELIGRVAADVGALIVSDEVYEHLTFDGTAHVPIATLPGLAERTLTIGSAGKTFSVTGWKIGWITGPAHLVAAARTVKQFLTFVSGGPLQPAVAVALDSAASVYDELRESLQAKRDILCAGLAEVGFTVRKPVGTYFVCVDGAELGYDDALALARELPTRIGVAAIPVQVFCDDLDATGTRSLLRFAFCKTEAELREGVARLQNLNR
ncbi:aminotransferase class I/II-fold pyridoxal phosphate-dependent enzyme [Micrococcales bacterium 31B]|nr:aminotransferase class I/II-fold pyridoxal phosphate-dependent enzyme [Micrococcales bacterium 31B]